MNIIRIYHGSDHIVEKPLFGVGDKHSDYGQGFYCTTDLEMGKEWANKRTSSGFVNKYIFDGRGLKVLDLTNKDSYSVLNWIAILMHFREISTANRNLYRRRLEFLEKRFYVDVREYDVIIGYRADDAYFKFPMYFMQNEISLEKLEEIYHLGDLGTQIAIMSEKAFNRIKFVDALKVEPIYHERYTKRKKEADERFESFRIEEINSDKEKLEDLMKKYD